MYVKFCPRERKSSDAVLLQRKEQEAVSRPRETDLIQPKEGLSGIRMHPQPGRGPERLMDGCRRDLKRAVRPHPLESLLSQDFILRVLRDELSCLLPWFLSCFHLPPS